MDDNRTRDASNAAPIQSIIFPRIGNPNTLSVAILMGNTQADGGISVMSSPPGHPDLFRMGR